MSTLWYSNIAIRVKYDTHVHIYNEILYILVDSYCSKYGVMGIYIIPHTLEYWATIAHDHNYDLIIMSYINSWSCYENPQDSSYTHASSLLSDTIGLRVALKKALAAANLSNVRILNTCCASECAPTDNMTVRLDKIRDVMATDGIHYSQLGYKNITSACIGSASLLHGRAANPLSSVTCKGKSHYWRSFCSPVGASACLDMRSPGTAGAAQRGRGHWQRKFHPYRR
jgi:hypothetical protein